MITTTLQQIRDCGPCRDGWRRILRGVRKRGPDAEPLLIGRIADVAGMPDALWALQSVVGQDAQLRRFAFLVYRLVRTDCSTAVKRIVLNTEQVVFNDIAWSTAEAYEAALVCATNAADSIAATVLHPDARWAARNSATAVQGIGSEFLRHRNRILIRGAL